MPKRNRQHKYLTGACPHIVVAHNYTSTFQRLRSDLILMQHAIHNDEPATATDVFSNFWSVAVTTLGAGQVRVKQGSRPVTMAGSLALFAPPFSILDWQLSAGNVFFQAYVSNYPLPPDFYKEPVVVEWESHALPSSLHTLFSQLKQKYNFVKVGRTSQPGSLAYRLKRLIDCTYQDDIKVSEMSERLEVSREALTRTFVRSYGMSPLQYRNRLRLSESIFLLLSQGKKISDVGFEVGFQDLSRYGKQFQKHLSLAPSCFQL